MAKDGKMREAAITKRGKTATDALDVARECMFLKMFQDWKTDEFRMLVRLLRMLADGLNENTHLSTSEN